jgi:hypothetical protein
MCNLCNLWFIPYLGFWVKWASLMIAAADDLKRSLAYLILRKK